MKSFTKPQYLSLSNGEKVIEFLKRSGVNVFSIVGGEPTLNPHFPEVVNIALEHGFVVRIFSNGLMPFSALTYLKDADPEKVKININVTWVDNCRASEKEKLTRTLRALGPLAAPAYTICQPQPDMDFLLDLIAEYHLRKVIRLGISQPIVGSENVYLDHRHYSSLGEKIVAFCQKCDGEDISIGFDCGFVLCMFTESELGRLMYFNTDMKFICGPILDIGPDLDVWSCFALSALYNMKLSDFGNRQEALFYYRDKFLPYRSFGLFDKCGGCKYKRRKQCSGGCLSHVIRSFQGGIAQANKHSFKE